MHLQSDYDIEQAKEKIGLRLNMIQALHMDEKILAAPAPAPQTKYPDQNKKPANIKRRMMR
jgi:hypothetical protein